MTIIAYRDGMLAADSVCVQDDVRMGTVAKVHRLGSGGIFGGSGWLATVSEVARWLGDGAPLDARPPVEGGFEGLWVDETGVLTHMSGKLVLARPVGLFFAVGSGSRLAIGAMQMGATAIEAARVAISLDVYCGGPIRWMTLTDEGEC